MIDDELYLYVTNDGDLYRRLTRPLQLKLSEARANGTYQRPHALEKFRKIVDEGAAKYRGEFGSAPFSSADRKSAAQALLDHFEIEDDLGAIADPPRPGSSSPAARSPAQMDREIEQWRKEQSAKHASARVARKSERRARPRAGGRRDV